MTMHFARWAAAFTIVAMTTVPAFSTVRAETVKAPSVALDSAKAGPIISHDIFGQFAEMLGEGIYGGVWVGPDSTIPNVRGIRTDVVEALRRLRVPNVRWPGGCFADEYHWRDGVGPAASRRMRLNAAWGGTPEPNAFGTHEFMDFVEQIGSEAYISVNVGSGTVEEAADWLEYMTADESTSLGRERAGNGRAKPWRVKYLGVGNESWGCGGSFTPAGYVEKLKQFASFIHSYHPEQKTSLFAPNPNAMRFIAVGQGLGATAFTEEVMSAYKARTIPFWSISGLSLHHYSHIGPFPMADDSVSFGEKEYAQLLKKSLTMEDMIAEHGAIMDRYDPEKKVAMVIDEWGAWLRPLPGRPMTNLRQQGTLRDAILAAVNLNIFARHADRVRMANIAQMVNVIQAMILTDKDKMLLTPTYHVFRMYTPFQDAQLIPLAVTASAFTAGGVSLPNVDAIAAKAKDGTIWIAITNLNPTDEVDLSFHLQGSSDSDAVGEVLTAPAVNAANTFEAPNAAQPRPMKAHAEHGVLPLRLPAKSVTVMRLTRP